MLLISSLPKNWIFPLGFALFFTSLILLVLTIVPGIGVKAGGATRWIDLPFGFYLEPSEFFKISLPFATGWIILEDWKKTNSSSWFTFIILGAIACFGVY